MSQWREAPYIYSVFYFLHCVGARRGEKKREKREMANSGAIKAFLDAHFTDEESLAHAGACLSQLIERKQDLHKKVRPPPHWRILDGCKQVPARTHRGWQSRRKLGRALHECVRSLKKPALSWPTYKRAEVSSLCKK